MTDVNTVLSSRPDMHVLVYVDMILSYFNNTSEFCFVLFLRLNTKLEYIRKSNLIVKIPICILFSGIHCFMVTCFKKILKIIALWSEK